MWVKNIPDGGLGRFPAANWEPLMIVWVRLTTRLFPNNVTNPQNHIWARRSSLSPCPAPRSAPHQRQLQAERTGSSWTAQSHLRSGKRVCSYFHLTLKGMRGRGGARTAGLLSTALCYGETTGALPEPGSPAPVGPAEATFLIKTGRHRGRGKAGRRRAAFPPTEKISTEGRTGINL